MFRAELTKLKRSSTWIIAVVLPVLAVITGTVNFAGNPDVLTAGWASFTSQVMLFYGLLFYSMGISLLAATVWRMEHRGSNWNLLLTGSAPSLRLVIAKVGVILIPVALMQVVLILAAVLSGVFVLRLGGIFPWEFPVAGVIAVATAVPLVAGQSLLSMMTKSFATPVGLCLVGCVIGVASVTSSALRPLGYVLPQAINTRALSLGSSALAESGGLTLVDTLPLLVTSVILGSVLIFLSTVLIRTIKLR